MQNTKNIRKMKIKLISLLVTLATLCPSAFAQLNIGWDSDSGTASDNSGNFDTTLPDASINMQTLETALLISPVTITTGTFYVHVVNPHHNPPIDKWEWVAQDLILDSDILCADPGHSLSFVTAGQIITNGAGNIDLSSGAGYGNAGGLTATTAGAGGITVLNLTTSSVEGNGGNISLTAAMDSIYTGDIITQSNAAGMKGGDIKLNSQLGISVGMMLTGGYLNGVAPANAGNIQLEAGGDISLGGPIFALSSAGNAGNVSIVSQGGKADMVKVRGGGLPQKRRGRGGPRRAPPRGCHPRSRGPVPMRGGRKAASRAAGSSGATRSPRSS